MLGRYRGIRRSLLSIERVRLRCSNPPSSNPSPRSPRTRIFEPPSFEDCNISSLGPGWSCHSPPQRRHSPPSFWPLKPWNPIKYTENLWKSMKIIEIYENRWNLMKSDGNTWKSVKIFGNLGKSMKICENLRKILQISENRWTSMKFIKSSNHRVLERSAAEAVAYKLWHYNPIRFEYLIGIL